MASALRAALDMYGARLGISGSSKIVADVCGTDTLMAWLKASGVHWPHVPNITCVATELAATSHIEERKTTDGDWQSVQALQFDGRKLNFPEHSLTHTLFDLADVDETQRIQLLRWIVYCLQPKGVAILHFGSSVPDEYDLKTLLEGSGSGFERGKVRAHEVEGGWVALAVKFDLLTA